MAIEAVNRQVITVHLDLADAERVVAALDCIEGSGPSEIAAENNSLIDLHKALEDAIQA